MTPIVIHIGHQFEGCTYQLHPRSRVEILQHFPGVKPVPSLFVGYETQADFEPLHGPRWRQIAMMLTGLSWNQIEEMGGVKIYDPMGKRSRKVA